MASGGERIYYVTGDIYLQFSWVTYSQSMLLNQTTIAWRLDLVSSGVGSLGTIEDTSSKNYTITVNGVTYSGTNTVNIGTKERKVLATNLTTINQPAGDTTTFNFSVSQHFGYIDTGGSYHGTISFDGTGELDKIEKYAYITSVSSFTDEGTPSFKYLNPLGDDATSLQICLSFDGSNDDIAYRDVSKTGSTYSFSLTEAERNVLQNACVTSTTKEIFYYLKTEVDGKIYYSNKVSSYEIINANPTLSPTVYDINTTSTALTGNNQVVIKGVNNMQVSAVAAGLKGATIESYSITCGGKALYDDSGYLPNVESGEFVFSVSDSRGLMVTKTVSLDLIEYVKLTNNLKIDTVNVDGYITFTTSGKGFFDTFGSVDNSSEFILQYRYKANDGSFGSWVTISDYTASGNDYSATATLSGLDYLKKYTIQTRAKDAIYSTDQLAQTAEYVVSFTPVFDWSKEDFNINVPLRPTSGFLFPDLPQNTDLNTITTAGFYNGYDAALYTNLPAKVTSGVFSLEVLTAGVGGSYVLQRVTAYINNKLIKYERRFNYIQGGGSWTEWDCVTYPVGFLYVSNVSTSPATLYGGTWTQISGQFLLGANSTYPAKSTGGEASHTLTIDEMPNHNHTYSSIGSYGDGYGLVDSGSANSSGIPLTGSTGGGQAHNNMPPYYAAYMWFRTA